MTSLLEIGLINAATATGLAAVVWLATRVWRHPVFVHTLWIVVLLKLITPPVVSVPWNFMNQNASDQTSGVSKIDSAMMPTNPAPPVASFSANEMSQMRQVPVEAVPIEAGAIMDVERDDHLLQVNSNNDPLFPFPWTAWVIIAWLTGTMIYLILSAVRLARFHRALAHAARAPKEIQQIAAELARRFGVVNRYRLRVTDGRLSPLVWPIGRPIILMPRRLLADLSPEEVATLLTHEFAHLCRRDHWVRWLELLVTAIYWWHPVVWWAKVAIGRAEERVCDAWVVARFAGASAPYASALFKAVQFASADRQAAPVVASALGGRDLKERIENIMNATWKPRLFLPVRLLVLAAAVLILPLSLRAVGEEDTTTQSDATEAAVTEDSAAAAQDAAVTIEDAVDAAPAATVSAGAAISAEAAPDALDAVVAGSELPAETSNNPFAAPPAGGSQPGMQPRRMSVPADPYHIAAGDVLLVSVSGAPPEAPIAGDFIVEPSGSVALGPQYGRVKIGGLSLEDAEKAVASHLKQTLREPMVQITIGGWRDGASSPLEPAGVAPVVTQGFGVTYPATSPRPPSPEQESVRTIQPVERANMEELQALREHVNFLENHFKKQNALYQVGTQGGSASAHDMAAYELAAARGQLALAKGNRDEATNRFQEAEKLAEQALKSIDAAYGAGLVKDDVLLQAAKNVSESKRRLVQVRRPEATTNQSAIDATGSRSRTYRALNLPTSTSSITESIGVLKKISERSQHDYQRLQQLALQNAVSATEVAKAKSEYEISIERLRQAERALKYHRAVLSVAEADYGQLLEANKRVPGAVTETDLRRAKLAVDLAEAKLEELAE